MANFPILIGFLLIGTVMSILLPSRPDRPICSTTIPYKQNNCNSCWCSEDGLTMTCGSNNCYGYETRMLQNCRVGTIWRRGCNTCFCLEEVGALCTDFNC